MLIVFAATYGVFAGGFSAIWSGMMREVQRDMLEEETRERREAAGPRKTGMALLMGAFAAGRGVGSVLCGPVSEVLLRWGRGGRV